MNPDFTSVRKDFPALAETVYGRPLVYLDNAATTHKPRQVIDTLVHYYTHMNSNIHRGTHFLSMQATEAFEKARKSIAAHIGAKHAHEIIFTRGTTESINLLANGFARAILKRDDEVLVSALEHHANLVPWQMACESTGAILKIIPVDDDGNLQTETLETLLSERTRLMALTHVSNALGTINDVKSLTEKAHAAGVPVLIDGAQSVQHFEVDVAEIGCDFFVFSGHKAYGPMGTGVLYGREEWLEKLPPYQGGGEMIKQVTFEKSTYNELPYKFEAGTPNVAGVLGLESALDYLNTIGLNAIMQHESRLYAYAMEVLTAVDGFRLVGKARARCSVISFLMEGIHPYDTGAVLDQYGIAVRTGHHCAQPLMDRLCVPGTVRASLSFYNTPEEIDILAQSLEKVKKLFL